VQARVVGDRLPGGSPVIPPGGLIRILGVAMAAVLVVTACGAAASPSPAPTSSTSPTTPSSAPAVKSYEIPTDTVKFGLFLCCADNSLPQVAIRKGFFKDVGITLDPADGFHFTASGQDTPMMQRGDLDINDTFIQGYLQTLNTFGQDIPPTLFYDIFLGISILKSPDNPAKTAQDFLDEGLSFPDAAKKAVEQLRGQDIATPAFGTVQPQQPVVYMSYAGMNYKDVKFTFIDDVKTAELAATPGRLKWAIPLAAPIVVQLIRNGWKSVIDTNIILEKDPGSTQAKQLSLLVGSSGLNAQRKLIDDPVRHGTIQRFNSVVYRTIDFMNDPATKDEGAQIIAELVNANQGTKLTAADVQGIYKVIDPLFGWEDQGPKLWNDNATFNVPTSLKASVQSLVDNGTLPKQDYDLKRFLVAKDLWDEAVAQQKEADGLFTEAASLTGDAKALVDKAKQQYDWHNYLDAVGFLKAALGK
jgi:hypothetical protein